ncbi:beta-glucosidase [bacterium]|nr:MAG: beta-glucosidase [bacterium]
MRKFPEGFAWGAATASYQIEGAVNEHGRGDSVWDAFCRMPGKVANGASGEVACDHYHRYADDARLMKEIGLPHYRLSVAWPRILPNGTGLINENGLDFYDRLVDSLIENGVSPAITLFHWDYPSALQEQGGWSHPDARKWFGDYAEIVFKRLGDRCKRWITLNEPWCFAYLGHGIGIHAPGEVSETRPYEVGHGLLLGHGEAVARFRALGLDGEIGLTTNHTFGLPYSDSEEDQKALWQNDQWTAGWFLDPVYKGDYNDYMKSRYAVPEFTEEERRLVTQPTDFMGLNFYDAGKIRWKEGAQNDAETVPLRLDNTTQMGWNRVPETLTYCLTESQKRYSPPKIYITENGCAYDYPVENGRVHDTQRVEFYRTYLEGVLDAIDQGANVQGYFAWSLMDNFEWAEGYRPRFGIVHVDYETQERTPKDSAFFLRDTIKANAV